MTDSIEYIAEGQIFHGNVPHVMGTRLDVLMVGVSEEKAVALWKRLCGRVNGLDAMLNRFDPGSEVSKMNAAEAPLKGRMSDEMSLIVALADEYRGRTCGLFDVVDAEGKLDFGGFAKGYFLKECGNMLREEGVGCAFVDFGNSSILGIGHHPYGDSWKVGVVNPFTQKVLTEISLRDSAMSTSGNTPSYTGHIRNPKTGQTCREHKVVTAVATDPLDVEILSTVLMIADEEQKKMIGKEFPEVKTDIFEI